MGRPRQIDKRKWIGRMKQTFLVLVLAHLLGDFALMPPRLFAMKEKAPRAALVHGLAVAAATAGIGYLLLGKEVWPAALAAVLVHIAVDLGLCFASKTRRVARSLLFFLDQWLHLMAVVLASALLPVREPVMLDADVELVRLAVLALSCTLFCSLGQKLVLRDVYPRYYRGKPLFFRSERAVDCLYGGVMFILLGGIPQWYFALAAVLALSALYLMAAGKLIQQPVQISIVKAAFSSVFIPAMFLIFRA